MRLSPYRTEPLPFPAAEYDRLPDGCNIVFASPSAVRAFFAHADSGRDFRYCALGPTTAKEVERLGHVVYARSSVPDLEAFLRELS